MIEAIGTRIVLIVAFVFFAIFGVCISMSGAWERKFWALLEDREPEVYKKIGANSFYSQRHVSIGLEQSLPFKDISDQDVLDAFYNAQHKYKKIAYAAFALGFISIVLGGILQ
ncbi:hypothetical protein [Teredinibacter sp. KSP-S5-2]|uniref:hypothetical protein n=1 Tax=Teredinibacter sp. KSP-S5-2 TaxID=3034506 RepID=UPI0029351321|nr:hypothetical protein [Teredinibacter sp. KSP-S5-2]WNO10079.1 hypothetical protein P5V12_02725 [Teredinibacter sp. KSP-S5-2]